MAKYRNGVAACPPGGYDTANCTGTRRAPACASATIPRMVKRSAWISNAIHRRACAVSVLVLLLGGCGDRAVTRNVALHECRLAKLASAAQCATVNVPEDRAKPDGRTLALFVAILPANTLSPDADPLFMLAGGPGQSAEALVPVAGALAGVRRTRDIVLIDPRGTGKSAPLKCAALVPRDPFDELIDADLAATAAQRCLAELRELRAPDNVDVSRYITPELVADVDAVRAALGYERINLWGGSYGTRVAQEFVRRYPSRVRSMVLDGVAPPAMRTTLDVWPAREKALADVLAACAENADCQRAYPNLNATLGEIKSALGASRRVRVADPRTGAPREVSLGFDSVVAALHGLVYAPEFASLIPPLLSRAQAGDFAPLLAAAMPLAGDLEQTMNLALHFAVTCAEDTPRVTASDSNRLLPTLRAPSLAARNLAACDGWPRPSLPADFYEPLISAVPTLILSGGLDPVTPPANGELVAKSLSDSRHVIAAGYGHIVSPRACAPRLVEKFIDTAGFATLPQSCLDYLATSKRPPMFSSLLEPK
jgi:pimeloyl-ACP methyl ester carboxylesterase